MPVQNSFLTSGGSRLNPLSLGLGQWQIDGVAVTATAAQLNNSGGAFHRQVNTIEANSYALLTTDNAFLLFFAANSNARTLTLPTTLPPNFTNGFEFLIYVSKDSGLLTISDPNNITEPVLKLSPGQGAIVDLVYDDSNNPHWVINTDETSLPKIKSLTANYNLTIDDANTLFLCDPASGSLTITAPGGVDFFPGYTFTMAHVGNNPLDYNTFATVSPRQVNYWPQSVIGLSQSVTYVYTGVGNNFASIATSGVGQDFQTVILTNNVNYTFQYKDQGSFVVFDIDTGAKTLTIPNNTTVPCPSGWYADVYNPGTNPITITSTDTIEGITTVGAGDTVRILKWSYGVPNVWVVQGDTPNAAALLKVNNLSDLTSVPTAVANLGLGAGYLQFTTDINYSLTNPLNTFIVAEFTQPGKMLILPPMNQVQSLHQEGKGCVLVYNNASETFQIVLNDGITAVQTLQPQQGCCLFVTDNSTANGAVISEPHTISWNGKFGVVDVTTDDLPQGVTNLYEMLFSEITTPQILNANNGYIANSGSVVSFSLPTTAAVGDRFRIVGIGAGGWTITQNAGQTIYIGLQQTTVGAGGSLSSQNPTDCAELVCVATNTSFTVISNFGNLTVV